jgi:hypothetical protein
MRLTPLMLVAMATGCAAEVDIKLGDELDSDNDGLVDAGEIEAGTDPSNPDSDGDNWLDGDEVDQGTDPNLDTDHPYTGGWTIDGQCRNSTSGTGTAVGDIANQFELPDQYGDSLKLHDFCDHTVLLVAAAFW